MSNIGFRVFTKNIRFDFPDSKKVIFRKWSAFDVLIV